MLGEGAGGAAVTGGSAGDASRLPTLDEAVGALEIGSGAFDCSVITTANTAAIPATATIDAG
jgi:hypothetical protein